jgi:hypothetical protein
MPILATPIRLRPAKSFASGLQPCVGFAGYPIVDLGLRLKAVDMLNAAVRPREFDVPRTAIFQTARLHRWLGWKITHGVSPPP